MNDDIRPDPDALLAAVKREEEKETHGKLKIFSAWRPASEKLLRCSKRRRR